MGERFLTRRDVEAKTSLSKTEIYRRVGAGTFPRPVSLGLNRVAWRESEIETWIEAVVQNSTLQCSNDARHRRAVEARKARA